MARADIFIQRETVSRNGSSRGRPYATGPTRGRRRHVASHLADRVGRHPGRRTCAAGSGQVGSPFPEEDRTVYVGRPNRALDRRDLGPRAPRVPDPRRERFHDAGGTGLHLRRLGDAGPARDGGGEIPRRVGERLGPTARVSKDQARGVRDERPGAPRLREPGIPPGTPLYGEATRVSLPDMLGVAQLTTKGLNNGAIVFGDA